MPLTDPTLRPDVARIYEEHKDQLGAYIARRVEYREDAEDILQSVFYNLSRIDLVENPIEHITSWLYTASRNLITDRHRKKRESPMPKVSRDPDDDDFMNDITDILAYEDDTPESEYMRMIIMERLEQALEELPPEQRSVFELTAVEGFSFKEISKTTGIAVNTLLSRKHMAVLQLREKLRDIYEDMTGKA